jgi:hypothetical protein
MRGLKDEAERLRLREVEGGFEPEEGVELTVVIDTGSSAISLDLVTRILTTGDAWMVFRKEDEEVAWVRAESVVMVRSKGGVKGGRGSRTGFG